MACSAVILDEAKGEYRDIVAYLADTLKSPSAAARFMDEFDQQVRRICDNPELFALSRIRELALLGYRAATVGSYLMLYVVSDGKVIIAHVFHQAQDYARLVL